MKDRNLWKLPYLRTEENEGEERHATWLELFFDLIFVVIIANLASALNEDPLHRLGGFLFLFLPVWWSWMGTTYYSTRFDTDDAGHRLLILLQMAAIVTMAVNVHDGLGTSSAPFALSYFAVRAILVLQYLWAGKWVPEARPLTSRYSKGFGAACLLWLLSIVVPVPWRFAVWIAALLVDVLTPLLAGTLHATVRPHLTHLPERFGLFVIIVLGESVAGVVRSLSGQELSPATLLAGFIVLTIPFSIWWLYFDNIEHVSLKNALSSGKVNAYQIWLYSHLPLTMGITTLAVATEHVLSQEPGKMPYGAASLFLCGSAAVVLLAMTLLCSTTLIISECQQSGIKPSFTLIPALLVIVTGLCSRWLPPLAFMCLVALLCAMPITLHILDVMKKRHTMAA